MDKTLVLFDGRRLKLSPLTYREFVYLYAWKGDSVRAFQDFKETHNYFEMDEINHFDLLSSRVEVRDGEAKFSLDINTNEWVLMEAEEDAQM